MDPAAVDRPPFPWLIQASKAPVCSLFKAQTPHPLFSLIRFKLKNHPFSRVLQSKLKLLPSFWASLLFPPQRIRALLYFHFLKDRPRFRPALQSQLLRQRKLLPLRTQAFLPMPISSSTTFLAVRAFPPNTLRPIITSLHSELCRRLKPRLFLFLLASTLTFKLTKILPLSCLVVLTLSPKFTPTSIVFCSCCLKFWRMVRFLSMANASPRRPRLTQPSLALSKLFRRPHLTQLIFIFSTLSRPSSLFRPHLTQLSFILSTLSRPSSPIQPRSLSFLGELSQPFTRPSHPC